MYVKLRSDVLSFMKQCFLLFSDHHTKACGLAGQVKSLVQVYPSQSKRISLRPEVVSYAEEPGHLCHLLVHLFHLPRKWWQR